MASSRGLKCIFVALVLTMLNACGGGGGSDDSPGGGSSGGNNLSGTPPPNNSPNVPPSSNDPNAPVAIGAFAYAANEGSHDISAYSINETTGALLPIAGSPFTANYPVSIVVTPSGTFAYVGHSSGSGIDGAVPVVTKNISIHAIDAATGVLTRVGAPVEPGGFPTAIAMHPSGKAIFVAIRGDFRVESVGEGHNVSAYAIDANTGLLTSIGSIRLNGRPGLITIDPAGRFAYVATTIESSDFSQGSSYISAFAINSTNGSMSEIAGSPMVTPNGWVNKFEITPDGRFAYSAGPLIGYAIDATTGALSELPGSPFSQSSLVSVHPSGRFAYGNEPGSDAMQPDSVTYAINDRTGALTKVGSNGSTVPSPLAFSPSSNFIYGADFNGDITFTSWDPDTGALTLIGWVRGNSWRTIVTTRTYR